MNNTFCVNFVYKRELYYMRTLLAENLADYWLETRETGRLYSSAKLVILILIIVHYSRKLISIYNLSRYSVMRSACLNLIINLRSYPRVPVHLEHYLKKESFVDETSLAYTVLKLF